MQTDVLETVPYALIVVTNAASFHDDPESRRTAWHTLMAARGKRFDHDRIRKMQNPLRAIAGTAA